MVISMVEKNQERDERRQPVFDTENLADEEVARSDPKKKSFWAQYALKAILNVDLSDDIEPKPLSEAEVDEVCRGALASGLTPGGFDTPFNK